MWHYRFNGCNPSAQGHQEILKNPPTSPSVERVGIWPPILQSSCIHPSSSFQLPPSCFSTPNFPSLQSSIHPQPARKLVSRGHSWSTITVSILASQPCQPASPARTAGFEDCNLSIGPTDPHLSPLALWPASPASQPALSNC